MILNIPSPIEQLECPFLEEHKIELWVKRDDLIHSEISGNKWRKLEQNIQAAKQKNLPIITFGGAYSNHIAAAALACRTNGVKSIGIIRGDEFSELNQTLLQAQNNGMQLHFVSRKEYRKKGDKDYQKLLVKKYGPHHLVPEGGANAKGVNGSKNIRTEIKDQFDIVCCAAGTGTTAAGVLAALRVNEILEVYPALKGGAYLENEILDLLSLEDNSKGFVLKKHAQLKLITNYHFGGFAKLKSKIERLELVDFVNWFYKEFDIPLDLIYNGKMMFGIFDRIKKGNYKEGTKLLVVHCGGIQGNKGMKGRFGLQLDY